MEHMMKAFRSSILALAASGLLIAGGAQANSLLGSLSDAANQQLSGSGNSTPANGTSMSQLTSLLNGSGNNLTSKSSTNAAGILQYCVQNNVLSATNATSVKDKLMNKLGIENSTATQKVDYQDGLSGILHTGNGQNLDLNNLGGGGFTQLKEKVKTKACNVVLKQAKSFL